METRGHSGRSGGGIFIVQRRPGRQLTERRRTCSTWRGCRVALGGAGTRAGFVRGRQGQLLRRFQQTHKRETPTRRARSWEASAPTRILQGSIMYITSARRTPRAPSGAKQCVARRCGDRHTPFQQEVGLWMPLCFEFDFLGFPFCRGASPRRRPHRQCDGQAVQAWTPWVSAKESHFCMGSRGAARGRAPVPRGTLWLACQGPQDGACQCILSFGVLGVLDSPSLQGLQGHVGGERPSCAVIALP
jgi:hypothetical protein